MPSTTRSQLQFERACRSIPGGVNSPARAFGGVGGTPLFIARGDGQYLYDVDGNRLLDYVGSWGPHILGHRHPAVIAAIQQRSGARHQLRGTDGARNRTGRTGHRGRAVDRAGADGQLRHRGDDERHPRRSRVHRPRRDHQVRRLLPRSRRQPARQGRERRADARRAVEPRRPARLHGGHAGRWSTTMPSTGRHVPPAASRRSPA